MERAVPPPEGVLSRLGNTNTHLTGSGCIPMAGSWSFATPCAEADGPVRSRSGKIVHGGIGRRSTARISFFDWSYRSLMRLESQSSAGGFDNVDGRSSSRGHQPPRGGHHAMDWCTTFKTIEIGKSKTVVVRG